MTGTDLLDRLLTGWGYKKLCDFEVNLFITAKMTPDLKCGKFGCRVIHTFASPSALVRGFFFLFFYSGLFSGGGVPGSEGCSGDRRKGNRGPGRGASWSIYNLKAYHLASIGAIGGTLDTLSLHWRIGDSHPMYKF